MADLVGTAKKYFESTITLLNNSFILESSLCLILHVIYLIIINNNKSYIDLFAYYIVTLN